MTRVTALSHGLFAAVIFAGSTAFAGGQFVGDPGSQGVSRAGAFAAKADDATALSYNPAALVRSESNQLFVGASLVDLNLEYQRVGEYENGEPFPEVRHRNKIQPIPYLSVVIPRAKYALSLGVYAPQGYGMRDLPSEVETVSGTAPAPQRYDAVSQTSRLVLPSVAIAYQLSPKLSVGLRGSWGIATLESQKSVQGLPNPGETPGQDSQTSLEASDMFIPTGGAGLHYRASKSFELAATYTAPIPIRAQGTSNTVLGEALREPVPGMPTEIVPLEGNEVRCAAGGQPGALETCVDIDLPMTATVGARWIARDDSGDEIGDIEIDVKWENWARASDYRVVVDGKNTLLDTPLEETIIRHGLQDTISVRLGGSGIVKRGATQVEIRAGVSYDSAAAPETWTRVDLDGAERFAASTGLGISFGNYRLDVGVGVVDSPRRLVRDVPIENQSDVAARVQPDINVPLQSPDSQPYHPHNAGNYDTSYLLGTVGLTAIW